MRLSLRAALPPAARLSPCPTCFAVASCLCSAAESLFCQFSGCYLGYLCPSACSPGGHAARSEPSTPCSAVFPAASAPGQGGGSAQARPLDGAQASKMRPVAAGRASGADPEFLEALRHSPNSGGLTKPLGGCAEGAGRPRWVRRRWQGCSPGAGALPSNSQQFREHWTGEGGGARAGRLQRGPCAPPCSGHTHTGPTAGGRGGSLCWTLRFGMALGQRLP